MSGIVKKITKKIENAVFPHIKPFTSAIITVGGSGTRMNSADGITKQFIELKGMPIVARTLREFQNSSYVDEIIVVAKEDEIELYSKLITEYNLTKIKNVVKGGSTRQVSVLNGFKAVSSKCSFVAIHDGVRCLITEKDINKVIKTAYETHAACASSKIFDTLKTSDSSMFIDSTLDRDKTKIAQTPQAFKADVYRACAFSAQKDGFEGTDDCMLAEHYGFKVKLVECDRYNIKITTEEDLLIAEAVLDAREGVKEKTMKIGHGYDVHRLTEGRDLILGGVKIPYEKGLDGHSDADVLIHAVMDAVIGAMGLGDIGLHFPDTDKTYKNADSKLLAKKTAEMLSEHGYSVSNIDATLIMQAPKVRPYIEKMQRNIAEIYSVDVSKVNIKATTEEGLGFTGNKEGIAAHAVCIIGK